MTILIGIVSIILHEGAHILVSLLYKLNIEKVRFKVTGMKVNAFEIEELSDKQRMLIYFAGPIVNLFIGIILQILYLYLRVEIFNVGYVVNYMLFFLNMLPAYPLDGSRILEIFLKRNKNISIVISYILSGIIILLFFITVYIHKPNLSLFLAGSLMVYSTFYEKKNSMYVLIRSFCRKSRRLSRVNFIENINISVYYKASLNKGLKFADRNRVNVFYVLNKGLKLLGIVYEEEIIEALKRYGNITFDEYLRRRE